MAKDEKKKVKKEKKNFFKNFKAELKKVIWPTPKQLANNTIAVISIVLITAVIVFVLDFAFEALNQYGINKLRDAVTSKDDTNIVNTIDDNANSIEENTTSEGQTEGTAENTNNENTVADNTVTDDENNSANEVTE